MVGLVKVNFFNKVNLANFFKKRKAIQNVDKDGNVGMPIQLAPGGNGRIYGVAAVKNSCQKGSNACDRTNGGCNQLCLPRPDHTRQCACSDESNLECLKSLTNN